MYRQLDNIDNYIEQEYAWRIVTIEDGKRGETQTRLQIPCMVLTTRCDSVEEQEKYRIGRKMEGE